MSCKENETEIDSHEYNDPENHWTCGVNIKGFFNTPVKQGHDGMGDAARGAVNPNNLFEYADAKTVDVEMLIHEQ